MHLGLVPNMVRWCIWNRILSLPCQIWWFGGILERSKFELLDTLCNYPGILGNKRLFVYPKASIVLWIFAPKSHYLARKVKKPTLNAPKWGYLTQQEILTFKCLLIGLFNATSTPTIYSSTSSAKATSNTCQMALFNVVSKLMHQPKYQSRNQPMYQTYWLTSMAGQRIHQTKWHANLLDAESFYR